MQAVEVTERIWQRLLDYRAGQSCLCCGDWSAQERLALDLYGPIASRDVESLVIGQIGQSLDGRIATDTGDSTEVSGEDGLTHLHRLRALVDAVVIGVKTALHDSPRLTVRYCQGEDPARVIIDPNGRLPNHSPVLDANGARRIIIQAVQTPRPQGVEVIKLATVDGQFPPAEIISALRQAGLSTLLVEGGSFTLAKFIDNDLIHRLQIAVSPLIIGSGQPGLTLAGQSERLRDSIRPHTTAYALGSEVVFDCQLGTAVNKTDAPMLQHQSQG